MKRDERRGEINLPRNDTESRVDIPFWKNGKCARAQSWAETKDKETICMMQRKKGKCYRWSVSCGLISILRIGMCLINKVNLP